MPPGHNCQKAELTDGRPVAQERSIAQPGYFSLSLLRHGHRRVFMCAMDDQSLLVVAVERGKRFALNPEEAVACGADLVHPGSEQDGLL